MPSPNEFTEFTLSPFANKLVQSGYVNFPQMQQAVIASRKTGRPLIEILQAITKSPLPPDLQRAYKQDRLFTLKILHGVEFFDPDVQSLDWQQVENLIKSLIPIEVCRRHKLIPLKKHQKQPVVLVAMVNPNSPEAQQELRHLLAAKQLRFVRRVITVTDYEKLIKQYGEEPIKIFDLDKTEISEQDLQLMVDVTEIFEPALSHENFPREEPVEELIVSNEEQQGPMATLVNNILIKAVEGKASEIQIEPQEHNLIVYFRQDGILHPGFEHIPKSMSSTIVSRLKEMTNLKVNECNIAQNGRMRRNYAGRKIDFWVSTTPSQTGEKVIVRVLNPSIIQLKLDGLISDEATRATVKKMVHRPAGLLLVTGPGSSGNSTTLYSLLEERNQPGINISTIENPIERSLPGVTQVEIDREKGLDYDSILQSFQSQDLDVICVDQIREGKTAKLLLEFALGHLVITSLPLNDSASAIVRLTKMGIDPTLLEETLIGVINQRLVRRVCPVCRLAYTPEGAEITKFNLAAALKRKVSFYKAKSLNAQEIEQAREKGRLCRQCNGIGYQGQIGVYEVLEMSKSLKSLLGQNPDAETLQRTALQEGMKSLLNYAFDLVFNGETTLEEIERVMPDVLGSVLSDTLSQTKLPLKVTQRLQEVERLLEVLTREFLQLKQELVSQSEVDLKTVKAESAPYSYEELVEPDDLDSLKREIDPSKSTIASVSMYEELTDPGDWDALRKELDIDKETIISAPPDEESSKTQINSPMDDPW
jgi:type IV pilus assembly protein PilB